MQPRVVLTALLVLAGCSKKNLGEPCDFDSDCAAGYVCFRGTCNTTQKRDDVLTAQSGVGSAPIERPSAGGERIKVRVTNGEGLIFAACAANERLVGGGCKGGHDCASESECKYIRSYPASFGPDDTLGARWNCTGAKGTMQAYALCQETTPSTSTAPAPTDAGVPDAP